MSRHEGDQLRYLQSIVDLLAVCGALLVVDLALLSEAGHQPQEHVDRLGGGGLRAELGSGKVPYPLGGVADAGNERWVDSYGTY